MSAQANKINVHGRRSAGPVSVYDWSALFSPRMGAIVLLLLFVLGSGVSVIYTTFKNRYLLNELQQLRTQRNELQVQWGQLLIEQSTFGLESRVERKATDELAMEVPPISDVVMVRYD
ncbi:MAG: cell division protein FtsL [Pseudomonadales bacterium]|nr:cell division protein FtsL [Pseudomonadales bacterium]MCP5330805.1 cell division protein FtsL [Pseudomonadales bacterium]MCP5345088.1 cell division protein FtsL [Pseudomonadales bacterium]